MDSFELLALLEDARSDYNSRKSRESLSKRLGKMVTTQLRHRDNHSCVYCGTHEKQVLRQGQHMHLDHVVPRNQGGTDDTSNLVTACHDCNSKKKDLSVHDFKKAHPEMNFVPGRVVKQANKKLIPYEKIQAKK